jgi:two-component system chemotaxis response regulator CheB
MSLTSANASRARVRAVVCDDSPFMRKLLSDALAACGVEVVGQAADGGQALEACARLRPDVLTLDLQMPGVSGMEVLRRLPSGGPGVIVVSAYTDEGSALAVEALSIGAAEVIRKPSADTPLARFAADLGASVQAAAASRRSGRGRAVTPPPRPRAAAPLAPAPPPRPATPPRRSTPPPAPAAIRPALAAPVPVAPPPTPARRLSVQRPLVVIASSTGGPRALAELLPKLPRPCGAGVVVVQHMPPGFTGSLAKRLDAASRLDVREAVNGDHIDPNTVLVAPGGYHLRIRSGTVALTDEPAIGGLRPRADVTIEDAARDWGERCVLVVLTGMGNDGTRGAKALKAAGGVILTEAEESCVVFGMPRAVQEAGLSDIVQPIEGLPAALQGVIR